jgi:hypothetical protein
MNDEQDGIWMESVFKFFLLLVCVQRIPEKSWKAPELNNGFYFEFDIVGNIRKSGEEISVDLSRNG